MSADRSKFVAKLCRPNYRMTWEIDVEAFSLIDAARTTKRYQADRGTIANIFEVTDGADAVTDFDKLRSPPERPCGIVSPAVV